MRARPSRFRRFLARSLWIVPLVLAAMPGAAAATDLRFRFNVDGDTLSCTDYSPVRAVVWFGADSRMTIAELAAYCAPVVWFSPDEPLLAGKSGKEIAIPEPFPFEPDTAGAVVYYRVRSLQTRADHDAAYTPSFEDRGASVVDLANVAGIDLDYFFYYASESGLGVHRHDVESVQLQVVVWPRPECPDAPYAMIVTRVLGKAHGIQWYDNALDVDEYTEFPIHVFAEEGKHASCPDKNGDGYFTPSYDVNRRINDAWGVRDIISAGTLFTGGYQSWMAKVRQPQHRVFPPLPVDSAVRRYHTVDGVYAPDNAVYELRPFPSAAKAEPDLVHFIADKGSPAWPDLVPAGSLKQFADWATSESFVKSVSAAFYTDGDAGLSIAFPFFVVKNLEAPMTGGFITQRMVFSDDNLRDFRWMANYSASASRWMDPYLAIGVEWDREDHPSGTGLVTDRSGAIEFGIKFRAGLAHSPVKFMTKVADFWGLRFGVKSNGFFEIDELGYVIEIGAGTW